MDISSENWVVALLISQLFWTVGICIYAIKISGQIQAVMNRITEDADGEDSVDSDVMT